MEDDHATVPVVRSAHLCDGVHLSYFDVSSTAPSRSECVVIMHGSGNRDTKETSLPLAKDLAACGHRVIGLDFSGSGDSSGTWSATTINGRQQQATTLLASRLPAETPLLLIGFSLGSQTSVDLLEHFGKRIRGMALCAPAVFSTAIRDVPFGHPDILELAYGQPEEWPEAPALEALASFPGSIVLALPEHDDTVPAEMTALIQKALQRRPQAETLVFGGADHLLDQWLAQHPHDRKRLLESLLPRRGSDG
ncbi:alpha/beta hydrolase [Streptomyces boninensis]|uniref:alpha/beta hydrolase n=1 Tax=Streptomyces boninensis TaxID=2039455 RepID=UPI003B225023